MIRCGSDARLRRTKAARRNNPVDPTTGALVIQSAFNSNIISYEIVNTYGTSDLEAFFTFAFDSLSKLIERHLVEWSSVSVNFGLDAIYTLPSKPSEKGVDRNFKTKSVPIYALSDVEGVINDGIDKISREIEEYQAKGSGYSLAAIEGVILNVHKHNPLRASCYMPLPGWILNTHSCDHTIYPDDVRDCFRKAILAGDDGTNENYIFDHVSFPTPLKDIDNFEVDNVGANVNVFALDEDNKVYPLRVSKGDHSNIQIDLLLLSNQEGDNHFVRIFDFHKLIRTQLTKHHAAIAICRRCFCYFTDNQLGSKDERLRKHWEHECMDRPARAVLPKEGSNILSFSHYQYKLRIPFVVYADLESLLIPINSCSPSPANSYTQKIQEHQLMSYCIFVKSDVHGRNGVDDVDFNRPLIYTGNDAGSHLMSTLTRIAMKVGEIYASKTPVSLSSDELQQYESATECHFCQRSFNNMVSDPKVLDHCHITGAYRGPSHSSCNLLARNPDFLPILFFNGSGYDFKFLVRELGKTPGEIRVLPNTEEKYISFSKRVEMDEGVEITGRKRGIWLRFLDACRFLQSSLDAVVKTLRKEDFEILPSFFQGRQLELLMKKGVFPYEYMDSWERLQDSTLPPKEKFYSSLTESGITDEEYARACEVWNSFSIHSLGDYMELYLQTDTLLLSEVFESFRREFLASEYGIDPAYHYTIPGLAYDGMLKISRTKLELLTDFDMLLMIERGIRGGLCQVGKRHAVSDARNALCHLDANNLYGGASTDFLPSGGFVWIEPTEVDILSVPSTSDFGYICEVDIEIPKTLHDYFNDYPPLPEKLTPPGSKFQKLLATLDNKSHYVVHYKILQFVVAHGCILKKVHRIIKFRQSAWMKGFITVNNEKRKVATSEFQKDIRKLLNNSTFGKSIESTRKRMDLRLVEKWERAEKLISRPNFRRSIIFDESLVAIIMGRTQYNFNKPIYVGFVILEMAKLTMLQFYYETMLKHYGPERLQLLYTDTDSFIFNIKVRAENEDWRLEATEHMSQYYDWSNLPSDHPSFSETNKKVLMKFKDETAGGRILEWIGLRSKMYSVKYEKGETKKAKGVKKSAIKNKLTFEDYKAALFENKRYYTTFNAIRSFRQILNTVRVSKLSLSSEDDKRFILINNIDTRAHGHWRNTEEEEEEDCTL